MGGVNAVKKASLEELQALSWLPDAVAEAVYAQVPPAPRSATDVRASDGDRGRSSRMVSAA